MLQISRSGRHFVVRFGYNAALVEAIKTLPRRRRRWSPTRQAWLIRWESWPACEHLLQRAGYLQGPFTPTRGEGPCTRRRREGAEATRC